MAMTRSAAHWTVSLRMLSVAACVLTLLGLHVSAGKKKPGSTAAAFLLDRLSVLCLRFYLSLLLFSFFELKTACSLPQSSSLFILSSKQRFLYLSLLLFSF